MNTSPIDSSKGNILIVDDLLDNLHLLEQTLTSQGYKVRSATRGAIALRAAKAVLPDLILLDINMPELDGYEVCTRLKADEQTAGIPVIFLSALSDSFDKVKAFTIGGVDYITKPFQVEEVLARVENHLTIRRLQKSLAEQNQQLRQEIAERQRVEQELFAEKELAQVTLQSIGDAVISTDALGNVRELNRVAEHLTRWSNDEVKGRPLSEFFKTLNEVTREPVKNPVAKILSENRNSAFSHTILVVRDGTEYTIDYSVSLIKARNGQRLGAVLVFHETLPKNISTLLSRTDHSSPRCS